MQFQLIEVNQQIFFLLENNSSKTAITFDYLLINTYLNKMGLNFFPYKQLWRISKQPGYTNVFGIVMTLILLLILGAFLVSQLVKVFKRDRFNNKSKVLIQPFPPKSQLSTNVNDEPFMIFIDPYTADFQYNVAGSLSIQASQIFYYWDGPSQVTSSQNITLVPCTQEHFASFYGGDVFYTSQNISQWLCLPLNRTYTIEGAWYLNKNYSGIMIEIKGNSTLNKYHNVMVYTLSSFINPSQKEFKSRYLSLEHLQVISGSLKTYELQLTENVIITDHSLFPWVSTTNETTWTLEFIKSSFNQVQQSAFDTRLFIQRSGKTIIYEREYYKLLDALSLVGGFYSTVLACFFFMELFGRIFFQLRMAKDYFKSSFMKTLGVRQYFTQICYKMGSTLGCCQDQGWKDAKDRETAIEAVNCTLDIIYLQRRIDFLEKGISLLFDEHQLQALYLCHRIDESKVKKKYKKHQIKDRIMYFLQEIVSRDNRNEVSLITSTHLKEQSNSISISPLQRNQSLGEKIKAPLDCLKEELQKLEGELTLEEDEKKALANWVQSHFKQLIEESQKYQKGDQRYRKSSLVYNTIDWWLRYLLKEAALFPQSLSDQIEIKKKVMSEESPL